MVTTNRDLCTDTSTDKDGREEERLISTVWFTQLRRFCEKSSTYANRLGTWGSVKTIGPSHLLIQLFPGRQRSVFVLFVPLSGLEPLRDTRLTLDWQGSASFCLQSDLINSMCHKAQHLLEQGFSSLSHLQPFSPKIPDIQIYKIVLQN